MWEGPACSAHLLLVSLLLQSEKFYLPGSILKAWPQSGFKGLGAPESEEKSWDLECAGVVCCGEPLQLASALCQSLTESLAPLYPLLQADMCFPE